MPDIFLGERPYIKNQVRLASDEFGESFGIGRPSSGVPTAYKSRGRAISPGVRRRSPRRPKADQISYQLAACSFTTSICFVGQLADEKDRSPSPPRRSIVRKSGTPSNAIQQGV